MKGTGNGDLIAYNTVDLGNVSGWIVNAIPATTFYWVGGSGNWNDPASWSAASGGTPGICSIPNRLDKVVFDSNSFSASGQFANINITAECNDMVWFDVAPGAGMNGGSALNIYGSLQLNQNMNNAYTGTIYFQAIDTGNTIKTNGVKMRQVYFRGQNQTTGSWRLLDDYNSHDNYFYFERGTLYTDGHDLDVHSFYNWTNHAAIIDFGSTPSTVKVQYQFRIYPAGHIQVTSDSLDIVFESTNHFYMNSGHYNAKFRDITFNSLSTGQTLVHTQYDFTARDITVNASGYQYMQFNNTINARNVIIDYARDVQTNQQVQFWTNTFESFTLNGFGKHKPRVYFHGHSTLGDVAITNIRSLYFGGNNNITSFKPLSGTCDQFIDVYGGSSISMATDTFKLDWVYMYNLQANGGATFIADNVYGTSYNYSGWNSTLIPQTNFYWVGGQGNWNDPNHWSYTSGGVAGVCPLPNRFDNVFFDVNSFSAPNQYVNANTTVYVNNMVWNNVNYPRFIGGSTVQIYGSLKLDPKLSQEETGTWYFRSNTTGNTVDAAGKQFRYVRFDGNNTNTGEWTLEDDLDVIYELYIDRGTFISGGHNISARQFYCWTGNPTTVDLTGTDNVEVTNVFRIYPNNFNLIMDQADIQFTGSNHF
jgi:hypothetical protein